MKYKNIFDRKAVKAACLILAVSVSFGKEKSKPIVKKRLYKRIWVRLGKLDEKKFFVIVSFINI